MPDPQPDAANPDDERFVYDEFAYFAENCSEFDLDPPGDVSVERVSTELPHGQTVSGLRWGNAAVEVVLVHGGAQNAHTWDTVALALRPHGVLAIDLPGHGRSSWVDGGDYHPRTNADAIARSIEEFAPEASLVVGMSLGGLTVNALAARHPELVRRVLIVDVTPGVDRDKAADVHAFISGPQSFESFGAIFDRTVEFNPTRTPESLRRGILHNAHRLEDGSWEWNYDRGLAAEVVDGDVADIGGDLWDDVSAVTVPYTLVRGSLSPVVDDADEAEVRRRLPDAEVLLVEGAGHSVQGDRPVELAALIAARLG